jgi:FkbM family methyltransferase
VILDIGANDGQSARQFLEIRPDAEVHSFEPLRESFQRLTDAICAKGFHAHNIAIGEFDGVTVFHQFEQSQTASCLRAAPGMTAYAPYLAERRSVEVPIHRLDTIVPTLGIRGPIDYMKIDVQGYEDRVIRGACQTLARTRCVMVEANFNAVYEGACLIDTLCHLLNSHGFRLVGTIGYLLGQDIDELVSADLAFERVAPSLAT